MPIGRPIRILSRPRGLPERSSRRPEQAPVAGPSSTMMTRSARAVSMSSSRCRRSRACSSMPMCCRDCASGSRPAGCCLPPRPSRTRSGRSPLAGIAVGGATGQGAGTRRPCCMAKRGAATWPWRVLRRLAASRPAQDRGRCRFCGRGGRRNKNRRGPTGRTHCRWR